MKRIIIFVAVLFSAWSCNEQYQPETPPQIVVEGWIESDGYPVVMLTTTVDVGRNKKEWASLKDNVIRWAKVSVSDGDKEVVLTGKKNDDHFPPYVYTTARIKGEAGKRYFLKVEYSGRTVTSETTIPSPVGLEWIKVVRSDQEGQVNIIAGLKDDPSTKDYYKFFSKVDGEDSTYVSSFLGLVDDEILDEGINEIVIQRGYNQIFRPEDRPVTFSDTSFVHIRLCTLDEASYVYWEDYEAIASLSRNPFFPTSGKIRSNINGGLGFWAGYGSSVYHVSTADSLKVK